MNHKRETVRECDGVELARDQHCNSCAAKLRECDSV